jgi:hypothetical protein
MIHATAALTEGHGGRVADLESGLLHARNLIEFLTERPGSKITAGDFLQGWKPLPAKYFQSENRTSRLRVEEDQPVPGHEWNPRPMVERVAAAFADFVAIQTPDRKEWFSGTLMAAHDELKKISLKAGGFTATTKTTIHAFKT